jgi:DNA-binding transcriptional MerR regulator
MKTLPQIIIDFNTGLKNRREEESAAGVGVRIKKIKQPMQPEVASSDNDKDKKTKSTRGRKSIRQVEAEADLIQIPEDEVLFSKQYYTMGEVSEMFRVNQSLLRFWEAEFSVLQPKKNKKGDRYFRPIDIKNLHLIYHLLRQRKYTIEGAKDFLKKNRRAEERFAMIKNLELIKAFLLEVKAQL